MNDVVVNEATVNKAHETINLRTPPCSLLSPAEFSNWWWKLMETEETETLGECSCTATLASRQKSLGFDKNKSGNTWKKMAAADGLLVHTTDDKANSSKARLLTLRKKCTFRCSNQIKRQ